MIDSLGEPPDEFKDKFDIGVVNDDYVPTNKRDPLGHGTDVLELISMFASEATFSTFQIFGERDENEAGDENDESGANRGDTIQALTDAAEAGVDVLNLSIGIGHECGGLCSLSRETERIVSEEGVSTIVATGNRTEGKRLGVHCPAMCYVALGVGGYVPHCKHPIVTGQESNQWWLERDGEKYGPFCGQEGCCKDVSCNSNLSEESWPGNVSWHNDVPDVMAPPYKIDVLKNGKAGLQSGTSFGTPIVSGLIAAILGDVRAIGGSPSPLDIKKSAVQASTEIDDEGFYKFNMGETFDLLMSLAKQSKTPSD